MVPWCLRYSFGEIGIFRTTTVALDNGQEKELSVLELMNAVEKE